LMSSSVIWLFDKISISAPPESFAQSRQYPRKSFQFFYIIPCLLNQDNKNSTGSLYCSQKKCFEETRSHWRLPMFGGIGGTPPTSKCHGSAIPIRGIFAKCGHTCPACKCYPEIIPSSQREQL